jgi:hypothetical protein
MAEARLLQVCFFLFFKRLPKPLENQMTASESIWLMLETQEALHKY